MTTSHAPLWPPPPSPASGLTTEIVRVTPPMAANWLSKSAPNRPTRRRDVARYAAAMGAGEWPITGEAVKFDVEGYLIDGKHRLEAVVMSEVTVPLMVIRGLPRSVQDVLDTGRARLAADQLSIHRYPNATLLASAVKMIISYEAGRLSAGPEFYVSHKEIINFVREDEMIESACVGARAISKNSGLRPGVVAAATYILSRVSSRDAEEFFARLSDGANLSEGSPILALRSRLRSLQAEKTRLPNAPTLSLVFRAWNAWRVGRTMRALPVFNDGGFVRCPRPE